ncbi:MAG: YlxR family protein [Tissierellia bacterium]|nr:YlxR family protein [Tissierellia bacterium]
MRKKKVPLRKCVACNENKPKKELIRIVKNKEGLVDVDLTGKMNGRGAYICYNIDCFNEAQKSKKLDRVLAIQVPAEVYDKLMGILDADE